MIALLIAAAAVLSAVALLALRLWLAERADDRVWRETLDAVAERYDLWIDADGREWATEKPGWNWRAAS